MKCPRCGKEIYRFPKSIRIKGKFQMIEQVAEITAPHYSRSHKYSQAGKISRIKVYQVVEDK